jgi:hypothetical protein
MAISNHERVGKALELLRTGLGPFVEREITNVYKDRAALDQQPQHLQRTQRHDPSLAGQRLEELVAPRSVGSP